MAPTENIKYTLPIEPEEEETRSLSSERLLSEKNGAQVIDVERYSRRSANDLRRRPLLACASLAGVTLLAIMFFLLGLSMRRVDELQSLDSAWDEVKSAIRFKSAVFNPRFEGKPSPYMGKPNPELDKLWYYLAAIQNIAVPRSALVKINRTEGAVEYPGTGKYQASIEAFHQLHCLNYIRMYGHKEYYGKFDFDMIGETPGQSEEHRDHCIESLRQRLMCQPDINIYTYHWTETLEFPYVNLYTPHRCIDWQAFKSWADSKMVRMKTLQKPPGAELLNKEPLFDVEAF